MKNYCEGTKCKKRNTCAKHHTVEDRLCDCIDWSNYGGGHYWVDSDGEAHYKTWVDCGDDGNYKLYEELTA